MPELFWPVIGGGTRGLEFLSLDYVGERGFTGTPANRAARIFIAQEGSYTFTLPLNVGFMRVNGFIVYEAEGSGPTINPIHLARGWHVLQVQGAPGLDVLFALDDGPAQPVPDGLLMPNLNELVSDLSPLVEDENGLPAVQKDLRFLSLRGHVIDDVRPLIELGNLEVLRLDGNAIRNIEDLAGIRVVDDGDDDFTVANGDGQWLTNLSPTGAAFEADYHFRFESDDTTEASWTFTRLGIPLA